jgi:hypothetical protein
MAASLTFYIFEGVLTGIANGHMVHLRAASGGGGGSTVNQPTSDMNNPYSQGVKTEEGKHHRHGGPIPAGRYRISTPARHPHLGLAARLDPYDADQERHMYGRDGFYIHGRGRHGSDGCIVPLERFQEIMAALTRDRGGLLVVQERMGGSQFA